MDRQQKNEILTALTELTGKVFGEGSIKREGTSLVLPASMSTKVAIDTLTKYQESQEAVAPMEHKTRFRYLDGVVATKRVLQRMTGMTPSQITYQTFFGDYTPPTINVQISLTEWEECPTGEFPVEIFEGLIGVSAWNHPELGQLFTITAQVPRKYHPAVTGFFQMVEEELQTNSIYRGQAITGEPNPTYLDLGGVRPENVVYSEDVLLQLDANVWSLLEHSDAMRENNLPLKRAVLLEGPYGTGKTLAAYLTAQRATKNKWTFIFVRPGRDSLEMAMSTAQLYQPSVVFFEDIDTTSENDTDVSKLLDMFDGVQAKGTEIVAILTTNHADRIHKGLVRPGRLDAVIHIGALDPPGIEKLIRATVNEQWLPEDLDREAIAASMEGYAPAFVKEAIDRAVRYTIARNEGVPGQLTNEDFIAAGEGLRPQLALMEDAPESFATDPVSVAMSEIVRRSVTQLQVERDGVPWALLSERPESLRK